MNLLKKENEEKQDDKNKVKMNWLEWIQKKKFFLKDNLLILYALQHVTSRF